MPSPPQDALVEALGIVFDLPEPGLALARLELGPQHRNPYGAVSGVVLYALVDYGMGAALEPALEGGETSATVNIAIQYLAPVRGSRVEAEARLVRRGRRLAHLQAEVRSAGEVVALAVGAFAILPPPR